jgi:hypothetical protein
MTRLFLAPFFCHFVVDSKGFRYLANCETKWPDPAELISALLTRFPEDITSMFRGTIGGDPCLVFHIPIEGVQALDPAMTKLWARTAMRHPFGAIEMRLEQENAAQTR